MAFSWEDDICLHLQLVLAGRTEMVRLEDEMAVWEDCFTCCAMPKAVLANIVVDAQLLK